jgi:membrane protease YdiL (CAAX protease family)
VSLVALAWHGVIPGRRLLDALPIPPDEVAGLLLTMGSLFPAALYVTWAADGRDGLRRLGSRLLRWRVGAGWWLLVLAGLPVLALGLAVLLGDTLMPVSPVPFLAGQAGLLLVNFAVVNLWEETAWSGVVQTRLERRHGILLAALITAIPFALVHTPLALLEAEVTIGSVVTALVLYLVLGVLFRPMLAVVMRGAAHSVLVVAVLHSVFNRTNNENGIAASLLSGDAGQLPVLLATVPLTLIAAVAAGRRLGRAYRATPDAAPTLTRNTTRPDPHRRPPSPRRRRTGAQPPPVSSSSTDYPATDMSISTAPAPPPSRPRRST